MHKIWWLIYSCHLYLNPTHMLSVSWRIFNIILQLSFLSEVFFPSTFQLSFCITNILPMRVTYLLSSHLPWANDTECQGIATRDAHEILVRHYEGKRTIRRHKHNLKSNASIKSLLRFIFSCTTWNSRHMFLSAVSSA